MVRASSGAITNARPGGREEGMKADLVLEGGGVKGIGLVGAISVLEERGYEFPRVGGTSAGAIVGALVAAGVDADSLRDIMRVVDYTRFRDGDFLDHLGLPGQALSVMLEQGVYEGKYLRTWIGGLLERQGVRTFSELRLDDPGTALAPEQQYRFVAMTSDVSEGRLARLPWDYPHYGLAAGDQQVADAVRASMSIPFFYEPVKLRVPATRARSWLVDGGMLSNFPVDVFDRNDGQPPRWPTFGIKLSARPDALRRVKYRVDDTISLARAMLGTMMSFHDQMHLDDPAVIARTIFVDTFDVQATDFEIDRETQERLYQSGRAAATRFLDGGSGHQPWNFEQYIEHFRTDASS
jgi:NTE family protein